jgi:8-oxo-dGTP pyrophosphatase MutT (NUDIX family)/GNAT superfamily N-acetyltransferase
MLSESLDHFGMPLVESDELDVFYDMAGSYDQWYEQTRKEAEDSVPEEIEDGDPHEREDWISDFIREAEGNEPSTTIFFRKPKWLPRGTWLVRHTSKDPIAFAKAFVSGTVEGAAPENLGLTFHERTNPGNLVFAFTLDNASPGGHDDYGKNAVLLQVDRAVEAEHISDGDKHQVVFDIDDVSLVIPITAARGKYGVWDEKGEFLFDIRRCNGVFKKIIDKVFKKPGRYPAGKFFESDDQKYDTSVKGAFDMLKKQKAWIPEGLEDLENKGYRITHQEAPDAGCKDCAIDTGDDDLRISVTKDGEEVAHAHIANRKSAHGFYSRGISVDPEHRRKGLATAMYQYAEKLKNRKLRKSDAQSDDAAALWSQPNRPFGERLEIHPEDHESAIGQFFSMIDDDQWPDFAKKFDAAVKNAKLRSVSPEEAATFQKIHQQESSLELKDKPEADLEASIVLVVGGSNYVLDGQHRLNRAIRSGVNADCAFVDGDWISEFGISKEKFDSKFNKVGLKEAAYTDPDGITWRLAGAGGLFYAKDTGRYLFAHRGPDCPEPNTWSTFGGKIDEGETPLEALKREVAEEAGYTGPMNPRLVDEYEEGGFKFHFYVIPVDHEFKPRLNSETQDYTWATLSDAPSPLHYGMDRFLEKLENAVVESLIPKECWAIKTKFRAVPRYYTEHTKSGWSEHLYRAKTFSTYDEALDFVNAPGSPIDSTRVRIFDMYAPKRQAESAPRGGRLVESVLRERYATPITEVKKEKSFEIYVAWKKNGRGNQKIGNIQRIVCPPTLEMFERDVLPKARKGFYEGSSASEMYQDMLERFPDLAISYVKTDKDWFPSQVTDIDTILSNVESNPEWAKIVKSEKDPEGVKWRSLDDEA